MEEHEATEEAFQGLTLPGGGPSLRRVGGALVSEDGRNFPIEHGIVRLHEQVDPALAAELKSQIAAIDLYTDSRSLMSQYERIVTRAAMKMLGPIRGPVLDAGCGVGIAGLLFPDLGLTGVDASFPLLCHARIGYRRRIECRVEALPFPDRSFDAVLGINLLHHVAEPRHAVAELARVLVPGGVILTVDPRRAWAVEVGKRLLRRDDPAYAPTHRAFGRDEYAALFGGHGDFVIERLVGRGFLAPLFAGVLDALGWSRRLPWAGRWLRALVAADRLLQGPLSRGRGLNLFLLARRAS